MPGFIGHTTGNMVALVGTTTYMVRDHWSLPDVTAVGGGILVATFILSPDMDLFNSRSMTDWGWARIFWWPYAKFVKHRDKLHIPVIGTLVRWAYMAAVLSLFVIPIWIVLKRSNIVISYQGDVEDIFWYLGYVFDLLLGATIADTMHLVLDLVTTEIKIKTRPFRPRRPQPHALQDDSHTHSHDDSLPLERDNPWNKKLPNSKDTWGK